MKRIALMDLRKEKASKSARGFTIVELMLAMGFVAILLIAIAVLTMNIGKIYNRGVTYKELNQVGSEITDDIRRSFTSAMVDDIRFVNDDTRNRLCLGSYSYVWNEMSDSDPEKTKYGTEPARLVKVTDPDESYCSSPYDDTIDSSEEAQELLTAGGNRDLYVYSIEVTPRKAPDAQGISTARDSELATQRGLYTIKITLGTGDKSRIDVANTSCNPPVGSNAGDEYCAIDTFTTVVSIGNTYTP